MVIGGGACVCSGGAPTTPARCHSTAARAATSSTSSPPSANTPRDRGPDPAVPARAGGGAGGCCGCGATNGRGGAGGGGGGARAASLGGGSTSTGRRSGGMARGGKVSSLRAWLGREGGEVEPRPSRTLRALCFSPTPTSTHMFHLGRGCTATQVDGPLFGAAVGDGGKGKRVGASCCVVDAALGPRLAHARPQPHSVTHTLSHPDCERPPAAPGSSPGPAYSRPHPRCASAAGRWASTLVRGARGAMTP